MMKVMAITGANSGLGFEVAKKLAGSFQIIAICRNAEKGKQALEEIHRIKPEAQTELIVADLGQLQTVAQAADTLLAKYPKIDVLLNNAGLFSPSLRYINGIESTLYVNHLSHMLLTLRLLPLLGASGEGRVINVASAAHNTARANRIFANPPRYSPFQAYSDSKLANILFTIGLQARLPASISTYALHPGVVKTNFDKNIPGFFKVLITLLKPFVFVPPEKGAKTSLYLAASDIEEIRRFSGGYFNEKAQPVAFKNPDLNVENAEKLWHMSMKHLQPYL